MNNLPPMTLFDYSVCSKENLLLKVMLPYIDRDFQPILATYIKYNELLSTIDYFHRDTCFSSINKEKDIADILSSMSPYMSEEECKTIENIMNMINTINMFNEYKDIFENMNSDESNNSSSTNFNMDLSSILSPEQQELFSNISSIMK